MKNLVGKKIEGQGYVIVVHSPKGGCGKSTTSSNLVASLISQGYSVQAIDLDQQGNTKAACNSYFQNYMEDGFGRLKIKHSPIINSQDAYNKMSQSLMRSVLDPKATRKQGDELIQVRVPLELLTEIPYLREENDFIIIDTPGIENPFLTQLILLADLTIVPVLASNFDMIALGGLVTNLVSTARTIGIDPSTIPLMSVINMCDKRDAIAKQVRASLDMSGLPCAETIIPRRNHYRKITFSEIVAESTDAGKPYFKGPKRDILPCIEDQESLLEEIFYFLTNGFLPKNTNTSEEAENFNEELTTEKTGE